MSSADILLKLSRIQKKPPKVWLLSFFLFIGVYGIDLGAQSLPLPFQNLSVQDGLPQNAITALVQDDEGFMWIGTQDGLARYDGYEFKVYRTERGNPNSLSHNFIWNITKDHDGILWITTLGNGMTRLDPESTAFRQYLYSESDTSGLSHWNTFSSLRLGEELWVGTNESLDRIDLKSEKRTTYYPGSDLGTDSITSLIRSLVCLPDSQYIWMSTQFGLTSMNRVSGDFSYYPISPFGTETNLRSIFQILVEGENMLITTATDVISLNFKKQEEEVLFSTAAVESEKPTRFHGFLRGKESVDYIYSSNGLFLRDKLSGDMIHRVYDPHNATSLSDNYIVSMMQSQDGALWLGTRNGLSTIRFADKGFKRFGKSPDPEKTLLGNAVNAFSQINDSTLLIGTSEGLEFVDLGTGEVCNFKNDSEYSVSASSPYILCIYQDEDNVNWVGARGGGLSRLDLEATNRYSLQNYGLDGLSVQYIFEEGDSLWLGTNGGGILLFSKKNDLLKSYPSTGSPNGPSHPYVYTILKDSKKNYWLGTPTGGINIFDPVKEEFLHLNQLKNGATGLSGNFILCLFQDSNETIWVGTTSGLSKLVSPLERDLFEKLQAGRATLDFKHFGRDNGFPNEVIYGIIEDESGKFWISTNEGLVLFDPESEKVIENFTREDGCQTAEYNQNAYLRLSNGAMAFGGIQGFHVFHPDSLNEFSHPAKPVITEVEVNNAPFTDKPQDYQFTYLQNDISFRFAGINYVNTHQNTYRYRLKGFDEEWYDRSSNRLVTYTNLDPGDYEFQVEAFNCDGLANSEPLSMSFSIASPPWFSWYAYIAYAFVLGLLIYSFLKWRTDKVRREERRKLELEAARSEEREIFRKRSARDFHDEAGNKITRINLLVELAKADANATPKLSDYLKKIARNTSELSTGMRDFNWTLDPEKDSLFDLLERLRIFGDSMYEGDHRCFELIGLEEDFYAVKIPMELRRDLLMIFKEAINNAVKYSESDRCRLRISRKNSSLDIELCDFGKGFNFNESFSGYGLNNMKSRAEKHQLQLEISSDPERGTCVKINLPHMGEREAQSLN